MGVASAGLEGGTGVAAAKNANPPRNSPLRRKIFPFYKTLMAALPKTKTKKEGKNLRIEGIGPRFYAAVARRSRTRPDAQKCFPLFFLTAVAAAPVWKTKEGRRGRARGENELFGAEKCKKLR